MSAGQMYTTFHAKNSRQTQLAGEHSGRFSTTSLIFINTSQKLPLLASSHSFRAISHLPHLVWTFQFDPITGVNPPPYHSTKQPNLGVNLNRRPSSTSSYWAKLKPKNPRARVCALVIWSGSFHPYSRLTQSYAELSCQS